MYKYYSLNRELINGFIHMTVKGANTPNLEGNLFSNEKDRFTIDEYLEGIELSSSDVKKNNATWVYITRLDPGHTKDAAFTSVPSTIRSNPYFKSEK